MSPTVHPNASSDEGNECHGSPATVDEHGNVVPCCRWLDLDFDRFIGRCETCTKVFNVDDNGTTEFYCRECAVWPYHTVYCSEDCQTKDRENHSAAKCAAQKRKKRVFALLDDLMRIFQEHTFIHKCTGISVREGMTTLTWSMPETVDDDPRGWTGGFIMLDFPEQVMPPGASDTAKSLARYANVGSDLTFYALFDPIFCGKSPGTADRMGFQNNYYPRGRRSLEPWA